MIGSRSWYVYFIFQLYPEVQKMPGNSGVCCDVVLLILFIKTNFPCGILYGDEEQLAKILLLNELEQPFLLLSLFLFTYWFGFVSGFVI